MCLNVIKKIRTKKKYGYKIFIKKNNKLYRVFQGNKEKEYPLNEAVNEFDFRATLENYSPSDYIFSYSFSCKKDYHSYGTFYQKGFHIYVNFRDAVLAKEKLADNNSNDYFEICRVFFGGIVCMGEETIYGTSVKVIVAEQMVINQL